MSPLAHARTRFNPRAPRGARPQEPAIAVFPHTFQSTRPARGATVGLWRRKVCRHVSIHAPRAGRDSPVMARVPARSSFNPRAPRGARRSGVGKFWPRLSVSIHAPRAGRDNKSACPFAGNRRFNPRAPRGARQEAAKAQRIEAEVSIHAPRAGRDCGFVLMDLAFVVSIHAPRAGRDLVILPVWSSTSAFQSTRPARGATRGTGYGCRLRACFNPRAPRGARHGCRLRDRGRERFNPRAPRGARLGFADHLAGRFAFQSTRPARGATAPVCSR